MINTQKDKQLILSCLTCQKIPKIQLTHYKFPEVHYNCENCKDKRIMYLNNFLQKNNVQNKKYSYCSREEHKDIFCTIFCLHCQKWLCDDCIKQHRYFCKGHRTLTTEFKIETKCPEHELKDVEFYCAICKRHLCFACKVSHQHETLFQLSDPSNIQKIQEVLKTFQEAKEKVYSWNKKVYQTVVRLFNKEIEKYKSRLLKVSSLFDINTKRNNDFISFFQILIDNYNLASKNADYYIITNLINNGKFNLQKCDTTYNSFDELYEKTCSYFSNDYIIPKEKAPQKILKKQFKYSFQEKSCVTLIPPNKIIFTENMNIVCFDEQNNKKITFTAENKKPNKLMYINEKILFVFSTGFYELSYIMVPWIIEFQYESEPNRIIYDIIKLQDNLIGIIFNTSILLFDLRTNQKISEVQNQNFSSKNSIISIKNNEIAFLNISSIYIWNLKENISNHIIELNQTSDTLGKLDKIDAKRFIAYLNLNLFIINLKSFLVETIIKINLDYIKIIDKDIILADDNIIYFINFDAQDFSLQKLKKIKRNKNYDINSIDKYLIIQKNKTQNISSYYQISDWKIIIYKLENK